MERAHDHILSKLLVTLTTIALIIAELTSGATADFWSTVAYILFIIEIVAWTILTSIKSTPKNPLKALHKYLDIISIILIPIILILKCLDLITGNQQEANLAGYVSLFALSFVGLFIIYSITKRNKILSSNLIQSEHKTQMLQSAFSQHLSSLDDFLTKLSAVENNPELFKQYFYQYFNIKENDSGNIFGNLLQIVNEDYAHIIDYLKSNYQNLAEEELALCALICLNFTPTSIGILFGNTKASSIYNRRYRLRKKLNLPAEIQIETFVKETVKKLQQSQL